MEEIQPVVNALLAANVLMRLGHGQFGIADPFVQEIWRKRERLPYPRSRGAGVMPLSRPMIWPAGR